MALPAFSNSPACCRGLPTSGRSPWAEAAVRKLAYFDPLTGLPNRRLLMERLEFALEACVREKRMGALLFIDLDNFKDLNDTLGHDVGDQLLLQVARRLTGCVRGADPVARFGGDEFVVLIEGLSEEPAHASAEAALVRHLCDRLGLELRSGNIVMGSARIEEQARSGRIAVLLHASDSSEDGRRKLDQAWRVGTDAEGSGLRGQVLPLDRTALSVALGRDNVVHMALTDKAAAKRLAIPLQRLLRYLGHGAATGPSRAARASGASRPRSGAPRRGWSCN